jgi:hypothetical protein
MKFFNFVSYPLSKNAKKKNWMILNVILYTIIRSIETCKKLCLSLNMNFVMCVRLVFGVGLCGEMMISQHFGKHLRCCLESEWG